MTGDHDTGPLAVLLEFDTTSETDSSTTYYSAPEPISPSSPLGNSDLPMTATFLTDIHANLDTFLRLTSMPIPSDVVVPNTTPHDEFHPFDLESLLPDNS
ncbi:hypothetical protein HYPSUDRAFT_38975 [Hypholoma sublateritium FD-334 SS-4]|uniref:Uncharacterized protein n=1 Tax=Hypholoma sublateritium (strain FD-334 SS-4) TaxID=945553 RepID=A0A0D2MKI8_HYPSF|nr:hypothetical protein HYPSUDRAFT_38975 [Hypholoma sublateritium FD-334 SS-4]